MPQNLQLIEEAARLSQLYGLGIVLAVIITLAFLGQLWLSYKSHRKDKEASEKREERLMNFLENGVEHTNQLLIQHDQRAIEISKMVTQANEYQRDEHKEMIRVLQQIGNKVGI